MVGGNAFALYLGHREPIILDLFISYPFDMDELRLFLEVTYGFRTDFFARNTLKGSIDNIKLDCNNIPLPLLRKTYM